MEHSVFAIEDIKVPTPMQIKHLNLYFWKV